MEVTKVIFTELIKDEKDGFKASCDIVLDDSMKLLDISLFKKNNYEYYLVFPSKQDIYKGVENLNKNIELVLPKNKRKCYIRDINRQFEEFYHPVSKLFYDKLLQVIKCGYSECTQRKNSGECIYIPNIK